MAYFKDACRDCPLRHQCTNSSNGRTIGISAHEEALARARVRQRDPAWRADYRATRPKVERKLAHLMRRRHGGRRARVRGSARVDADFTLLAGATNLARLAILGVRSTPRGWVTGAV
jgi:IS5 family transposase